MDPRNDDLAVWDDEEICALTAAALPPLLVIKTHGDSSQGNHQRAVGPSSSSSSSSSSRPIGEPPDYMFYSIPEIKMLITAVSIHRRNWKEILGLYFNDSGRTDRRLKEKWRHMLKLADKEKDPKLKDLYLRAKAVDALYPKKYYKSFAN